MRLGWIVLFVLSFPVLEAIGIVWMASHIGWWTALWLAIDAIAGVALVRAERLAWDTRLFASLQSGLPPLSALFASGRVFLAGGLLAFPGFLSDLLALILLLMPGAWFGRRPAVPPAANDGILEGEFRRETDDIERLP